MLSPVFPLQYYYSVRVFAGQEPSGVWVGWITPDYHQYDLHFDLSKVRNVTVTVGDDKGNIHDRCLWTHTYTHLHSLTHIRTHTHTHTHRNTPSEGDFRLCRELDCVCVFVSVSV